MALFGVFGLIVGSFLNVFVLRWGTGRGMGGRSACMSCGYQLRWYDLVPIFSWLLLKGRCRSCSSAISFQYPLVELLTALSFAFLGGVPGVPLLIQVLWCIVASLLLVIAIYDLRHTIIPDTWVYAFCLLALLSMGPAMTSSMPLHWYLVAGPLTAFPLFGIWLFSRGTAMGFGDVKLAVGIGYLLGPWFGLGAIMCAFMIGGLISVPLLVGSSVWWRGMSVRLAQRGLILPRVSVTMKSEIPFGPFLVLATFLLWLLWLYGLSLSFS